MTTQQGGSHDHEGLFIALKGLLESGLATGRTRLELLVTEAEEEKLRLIDLLVSASAAVFLLSFALILLIGFLVLAFWEQRLLVLGLSAGATAVAGIFFALHLRSRLKQPARLFRSSIREIGKDIEALQASKRL